MKNLSLFSFSFVANIFPDEKYFGGKIFDNIKAPFWNMPPFYSEESNNKPLRPRELKRLEKELQDIRALAEGSLIVADAVGDQRRGHGCG